MSVCNKKNNISNTINTSNTSNISNNSNIFHKNKIFQVYISRSLKHFDRIKRIYNLKKYYNKKLPLLVFGLYNYIDLSIIKNHKNKIYIIWGGSDLDNRFEISKKIINKIRKLKNIYHLSISTNIEDRLNKLKFKHIRIKFNLADPILFKPVNNSDAKYIYIYNGLVAGREWIYGKEIYEEVMRRIPEFKYILSNTLKLTYEEMPKIYSTCFIGLRLTINDGNANTSQELELMKIPIIHNGDCSNCIKWNNVDDVEREIRIRNIQLFNNNISEYKNILFISNDNATNNLIKWYSNNFNVYNIILNEDNLENNYEKNLNNNILNRQSNNIIINKEINNNILDKNNNNNKIKVNLDKCLKYFNNNYPDLIIYINCYNIDYIYNFININCPKYLLLSIFNKNIININKYMNKIYVSNKSIYDKLKEYNIKSKPLFFNYLPNIMINKTFK